ncbi:adhesion domain-containing protein [Vibrio chagasii]|uniref:adhesion domain-containing protein n=1 Tax=Vibrio chagasii TaxID=170679 RepID=UPI00373591B5
MIKISTYSLFYKPSLSVAVSFGLFGCDASSDEATTNSKPDSSISGSTLYYAQDVIHQSTPTDTFFVNLSNSMESSDDSPVTLTTVMPLNDNYDCDVISLNTNGFTISAQSAKVCDYRYRVGSAVSSSIPASSYSGSGETRSSATSATSGDGFAEATVRAAVGESTEVLVPISGVTSSFISVPIDIAKKLGNAGYSLDTSTYALATTVTLPNGDATNSTAIVNTSTNTIDYTPGDGIPSGVERVLYTYSDGSSVLAGSIDIAVSTDTNSAPTAESRRKTSYIDPDSGDEVAKIPYGKQLRFNVADLISDPNGDTLHVVDIYSFSATILIPNDANNDGNLFNDTEFDFTSTQPGETSLSYVVSDGKGGYATGILQIYVGNPYEPIVSVDIYLPPLMYADAKDVEILSTPQVGNGTTSLNGIITASHDWDTGNHLCQAKGARLPTTTELQNLYDDGNTSGGLFTNHNWPIDVNYWASDQGTSGISYHRSVNMADRVVSTNDINSSVRYTACIDETPPGYPIKFLGDDIGNDYLFDTRINAQVTFGCGYIVDSISQVGGAHIGGTGGSKHTINVADIGRVRALWGPTEFGSGNDMSRLYLYDKSGASLLTCGSKSYSGHTSDEYTLTTDEHLTSFRAAGDSYLNGIELWVDTE